MSTDLTLMGDSPFDAIRRTDEHGEYWSARDLMPLLGYTKWERFEDSIDRARISAQRSGHDADAAISRLRGVVPQGGASRFDYHEAAGEVEMDGTRVTPVGDDNHWRDREYPASGGTDSGN